MSTSQRGKVIGSRPGENMRAVAAALLILLLGGSPAEARTPRGNRGVGITLTAIGIANIALLGVFIPLLLTPDNGHDSSIIIAGAGMGGTAACAVLGTAFLSVGIPFWVLGQRDLDRERPVSLSPTGLRVEF
jgi:hypothetical protein